MFFRQKKSPSGTVLQLIQSYRNECDQPRQRVIISLGDACIPEQERTLIAQRIDMELKGQRELIESVLTTGQCQWVDRILRQIREKGVRALAEVSCAPKTESRGAAALLVDLDCVEHTQGTPMGTEMLGLKAWEDLHLSQALSEAGLNPAQIRCAQVVVLNRLVEPVSEHALRAWLENASSLPDLLGEIFSGQHVEGRFYRVGDLLYKNASALEAHLRKRQESLFGNRAAIYLYDLTNTYFEGRAAGNPEARRSNSKEKRSDCPLVSLAIAYAADGMPLGHKIFAGNTHDATTFKDILAELNNDWADLRATPQTPLFILDGGIASAANLRLLRAGGYDYLVADKRPSRGAHADAFADESGFEEIPGKGVYVKMQRVTQCHAFPAPPPPEVVLDEPQKDPLTEEQTWEETLLYCRSEARATKETAMLQNARQRLEADLEKLRVRLAKGRLKDPDKANQAIGRLRQRHSGTVAAYEIELLWAPVPIANDSRPKGQPEPTRIATGLVWHLCGDDLSQTLCGHYCLRATRTFAQARDMWELYISLTNAEDGFRCLKTHLGLRPVRHQKAKRVRAHLFISILALHLMAYIKKRLCEAGEPPRDWTTIKILMRSHTYATLSTKLQKQTHHLRKPGNPNLTQKAIYSAMGIDLSTCPKTRFTVPDSAHRT